MQDKGTVPVRSLTPLFDDAGSRTVAPGQLKPASVANPVDPQPLPDSEKPNLNP
jgi:hypothetical protein